MSRFATPLLVLCAGTLLSANAAAGATLYASVYPTDVIYAYATNGSRTTFATGLNDPQGLVFDSHGDLFAGDYICPATSTSTRRQGIVRSLPAEWPRLA